MTSCCCMFKKVIPYDHKLSTLDGDRLSLDALSSVGFLRNVSFGTGRIVIFTTRGARQAGYYQGTNTRMNERKNKSLKAIPLPVSS